MPTLGLDRDFLLQFGRLERQVQSKVHSAIGEFEEATHTGLHLEKIAGTRDPRLRSIRIDKFWRGIVLALGDEAYALLQVLPHDDAYAWARRQRASVNRATGALEVHDVVAVEEELPTILAGSAPAAPLLAAVSDADLVRLGVDDDVLPFARGITDVDQLDRAQAILPDAQYLVLSGLAAGYTPEEVWAEVAGEGTEPGDFDPDDIAAALPRSGDRIRIVSGPDDLLDVFERPFALWRVFLHPAQRRVADKDYSGPARVSGGPGTGKTVVALHRAQHLARAVGTNGSVLLTTFTRTLAATLERDLAVLFDDESLLRRVEVRGVDQIAHRIVSAEHGKPLVLTSAEQQKWWAEVAAAHAPEHTPAFLAEEWRSVVLAQDITDALGYVGAARVGRGKPLAAAKRGPVWRAIRAFSERLAAEDCWTHETVCVEAAHLLAARTDKPYRHVIVDEAQDLAPWQWRLLRAAVAPGRDDMFLAGDAHQRIYSHRVSLRSLGVNVAGRSERLRINYRTTAEILRWSVGLLHGERIDGLDADVETLTGCRSLVHGPAPALVPSTDRAAELDELVATVRRWCADGVELGQIGVAARTTALVGSAVAALRDAGLDAMSLADRPQSDTALSVATMHRMKGLEFRCVAVIGVADGLVPTTHLPPADDPVAYEWELQRERCLLFVACTRAREQLSISWSGAASPFLGQAGTP